MSTENASSPFFENSNNNSSSDVFAQEFDVTRMLVIVRKNLVWMVTIFTFSILGAFFFIRYTKPVFESRSQIKLDLKSEASAIGLSKGESSMEEFSGASKLIGEVEFIKSQLVIKSVVAKSNLQIGYFVLGDILFEERFQTSPVQLEYSVIDPSMFNQRINISIQSASGYSYSYLWGEELIEGNASFGNTVTTDGIVFKINKSPNWINEIVGNDMFCVVYSQQFTEGYISQSLTVDIDNVDAKILSIGFKDFNKYKAAYIVDLVDSVYLEQTIELKTSKQEKTLDFLKSSLGRTEQNLLNAENDLEKFLEKNKTGEVKSIYDRVYTKIEELEKEKNRSIKRALLI